MSKRRRLLNGSVYLLAIIALVSGYLVVSDILRRNYEDSLSALLQNNLQNSERAVERWVDTRTSEVLAHANDPMLLAAVEELMPLKGDVDALLYADAQRRLRTFFGSFLYLQHVNGYFLIAPDGTSLASSRDVNIGTPNLLLEQPQVFERLLQGEALLTQMTRSDVPLSDSDDIRENVTNFAAAPLRNFDGSVVAILALRLFPNQELFQLLNFVESSAQLHTYAFNAQGALLSHVNEVDALRATGQWQEGHDHLLSEPPNANSDSALPERMILPVRRALQGQNGSDIQGYTNYAGDKVVGAWHYFEDLGFGIVIEQPYKNAYNLATTFQTLTIVAFSIGLIVVTLIFLWMLEAGKRIDAHRQRLLATMKATRDVNFQVNSDGIIHNVNDALNPVFGLERRYGIGHSVSRFLELGEGELLRLTGSGLRKLANQTQEQVLRCTGIRDDGTKFPIGIRVEPLNTDGKAPVEFLIVAHDYSDIDRRESELREALQRAESGNRTKSSFLSTISHELRSPLISVIAALELLTERASSTEDRNLLDSSQRSAQLLLGIIDDILDFSRMEADKLELSRQPISLEAVQSDVIEMLRWQAWNNDVDLIPYCDPALPLVQADGLRLRQILLNLTSNAIKFSAQMRHPGRVSVAIRARDSGTDMLDVTLTVRDNGIGMTQDTMEQIFQPFTQADGSIRRKYGGTGLGLTISDRLIKMMDGHISVMSDPGEGTRFEVKLQLRRAEKPAEPVPSLEGCNILMGAANGEVADTLARYARAAGAKVALADDPSVDTQGFGANLLVLQSVGAAEAVRLLDSLGPIPVLQIRSNGRELPPAVQGQRTIAMTSLLPADVVGELAALHRGTTAPADIASIPQSRVLLIEDDEMTREITLRMLKQLGIAADAVINGQEGLELWRSGQYALLLSDCHMPIMDGFQMAARIRDEEGERNLPKTPIIAVSADLTMEVERLCVDCEIDEYVPKPLTPAKLRAILQTHIRNGKGQGQLDS
ncbi:ATP-binding protein [Thalassovita sp.]|uniref:ATP-binding protein n=1 Tax=Thalassovita sp. TaxID=1979401 RepID=UPI002AB0F666|nr:ATP-binding protein [Thalassovita sp.]